MEPHLRLAHLITQYLQTLPPEHQALAQPPLARLLRWFGRDTPLGALTPQEVVTFAQTLAENGDERTGQEIKAFLTYLKRRGLTEENLGKYIRTARGGRASPKASPEAVPTPVALTPEGLARLRAEAEELQRERVALAEEVRRAAADKDVRENAPLQAARERLAWVNSRLQEIEALLHTARVMDAAPTQGERRKVVPGCTVHLLDVATGREHTYTLVDPRESNPSAGRISTESPVGRVLLERCEGEEVEVRVPRGVVRYRILRVT
jgi:transcription elongation factor GreA